MNATPTTRQQSTAMTTAVSPSNSSSSTATSTRSVANNHSLTSNTNNSNSTTYTMIVVLLWHRATAVVHRSILQACLFIALTSARHPIQTILGIAVLSIVTLGTGLATNFEVSLDDETVFAPHGCRPRTHHLYLQHDSGFSSPLRPILLVVHANGDNVVGYHGISRILQATQTVRQLAGYASVCGGGRKGGDCRITSPSTFWNHNQTLLDNDVVGLDTAASRDLRIATILSQPTFPDGTPIAHNAMMGHLERDYESRTTDDSSMVNGTGTAMDSDMDMDMVDSNSTITTRTDGIITYAVSFGARIELPNNVVNIDGGSGSGNNLTTLDFETEVLDALQGVRNSWMAEGPDQPFRLEVYTPRAVPDEMGRAVAADLPLLPLVLVIMTVFTCAIFARNPSSKRSRSSSNAAPSRAVLGLGSVCTILASIMTGFGFSFILGLPFTNLTQVLPFVIFGVGLDDTFILTGAYFRTDATLDPVVRIQHTIEEIGASISLTTITTSLAFFIGYWTSSIPTIEWLCLYALFTIGIDFLYQISFFVAIIVIDERRVQANRRDCCCCLKVPIMVDVLEDKDSGDDDAVGNDNDNGDAKSDGDNNNNNNNNEQEEDETNTSITQKTAKVNHVAQPACAERFMAWYCEKLLHPVVKVLVLIVFTAFFAGCIYSTTKLKQDFSPSEFLPDQSFALDFIQASDAYMDSRMQLPVFFRGIDQSDPDVQQDMISFLEEFGNLTQIQSKPNFCWVTDFQAVLDGSNPDYAGLSDILNNGNMTFTEQLDLMLAIPAINQVYGNDIARNEAGEIQTSRCFFGVGGIDLNDVHSQTGFLADQRALAAKHPLNEGHQDEFNAFSFDGIFFLWEFYTAVVDELKVTTVSGIAVVTLVSFLLIPHWTASLFICPMMCILYIDLLGTLQFAGMRINPLVYICLVMSIGLLVDFLVHILLRYYESEEKTREGKVKDTLKTMGASILVGGLSTCLGVIPLAFSTSGIISTVFVLFVSMITLGVAHGLIFLPVVLSYIGPVVCVKHGAQQLEETHMMQTGAGTPTSKGAEDHHNDCGAGSEGGSATRRNSFSERVEQIDC